MNSKEHRWLGGGIPYNNNKFCTQTGANIWAYESNQYNSPHYQFTANYALKSFYTNRFRTRNGVLLTGMPLQKKSISNTRQL